MSTDSLDDPNWAVQQLKVEFRFRRNSALVSENKFVCQLMALVCKSCNDLVVIVGMIRHL